MHRSYGPTLSRLDFKLHFHGFENKRGKATVNFVPGLNIDRNNFARNWSLKCCPLFRFTCTAVFPRKSAREVQTVNRDKNYSFAAGRDAAKRRGLPNALSIIALNATGHNPRFAPLRLGCRAILAGRYGQTKG
mgnify:CR=1 FL=1